jgi:decaprenylphospho-beta-D-ribofuranose 2-oxidase
MTRPDATLDGEPTDTALLGTESVALTGWGGGVGAPGSLLRPAAAESLQTIVGALTPRRSRGAIARGMGRSYGDAAQLARGFVIDMTRFGRLRLDPGDGTMTAEAGATIAEVLDATVPRGWIMPVVPGTQHVTIGGAIASDIHGKNHGTAGTLGSHVQALGLLTAAGEVLELVPGAPGRLFEATVGGMGLTGVILWARITMRAVSGPLVAVDTDRAESLEDALALLREPGGSHRVAWLDLLGRRPGRGIVTRAEHLAAETTGPSAGTGSKAGATVRSRATVPARWPGGLLRASSVAAFNEVRFRLAPRRERGKLESFGAHMFPLDALAAWPRLYGRAGFVQYQLVVPGAQEHVLSAVLDRLRAARVPCFLAVLKDFGAANQAPLSFPIEGWTLALDLPRAAPGLEAALRQCDEAVAAAGGRVYLSKDSRIRPDMVAAMYPRLGEWRAARDRADPEGLWRSDMALRTGLVDR